MNQEVQSETPKFWPFVGSPEELGDVSSFYSKDGKGEMAEMNKTGDTKTIWDSKNADEVEAARKQFEYFTKEKKYSAFAVAKSGEKTGEPLKAFDPNLEKIIFVKPLAGG